MANKKLIIALFLASLMPIFPIFAINDVISVGPTNFEILSTDTAILKTIVEADGGVVTAFDVQSNYIDVTLDNGSSAQFNTDGTVFFNITKQSGTNNYIITPTCPGTSVTLSGNGVGPVVLRMRVYTNPPPCRSGGGGGGAIYPINYSISINNGAATTTSRNVTLRLTAQNAAFFLISNDINFIGAEWQPFSGEMIVLDWILTEGYGTKAVYAMFKSSTGNLSTVISASINFVAPEEPTPPEEEKPPLQYGEFTPPPVVEESAEYQDFLGIKIKYGDLIKGSASTVYYYAKDGKRYIFPNAKTYFSWYEDFSLIKKVPDEVVLAIPRGSSNVTYRPGIRMVKMQTDPKVYAVDANGLLRWVVSEEVAFALYGENWAKKIDDLPEVFFTDYKIGKPIYSTADFNPFAVASSAINIAVDKKIGLKF